MNPSNVSISTHHQIHKRKGRPGVRRNIHLFNVQYTVEVTLHQRVYSEIGLYRAAEIHSNNDDDSDGSEADSFSRLFDLFVYESGNMVYNVLMHFNKYEFDREWGMCGVDLCATWSNMRSLLSKTKSMDAFLITLAPLLTTLLPK